jgi:hypothetical protein
MPTRVRFRFNKLTGEVEEFLVDDQDQRLPEAEHDRIAAGVARMVAVSPGITPVDDAEAASIASERDTPGPARATEQEREPERDQDRDEPAESVEP